MILLKANQPGMLLVHHIQVVVSHTEPKQELSQSITIFISDKPVDDRDGFCSQVSVPILDEFMVVYYKLGKIFFSISTCWKIFR